MTTKQITVTLPDWILEEIVGKAKNRSQKVQELIIKGHFYEKNQEKVGTVSGHDRVLYGKEYFNALKIQHNHLPDITKFLRPLPNR